MKEKELTPEQKKTIRNIMAVRMISGSVGTIGGAVLAYKKGGGFWKYVGFILLGGIVAGSVAAIITAPMVSKIEVELNTK